MGEQAKPFQNSLAAAADKFATDPMARIIASFEDRDGDAALP
jgi:hypothetical protein